jgi:hypothetical protein
MRGKPSPTVALLAVLPVFIGGLTYAMFRSSHLAMFGWFDAFGLRPTVLYLREIGSPYRSRLPDLFLFSLPNGLWLLSYCLLLCLVWRDGARRVGMAWVGTLYALAIGSECLQFAGLLRGTFDWTDVAAYTASGMAGVLLLNSERSCHV